MTDFSKLGSFNFKTEKSIWKPSEEIFMVDTVTKKFFWSQTLSKTMGLEKDSIVSFYKETQEEDSPVILWNITDKVAERTNTYCMSENGDRLIANNKTWRIQAGISKDYPGARVGVNGSLMKQFIKNNVIGEFNVEFIGTNQWKLIPVQTRIEEIRLEETEIEH